AAAASRLARPGAGAGGEDPIELAAVVEVLALRLLPAAEHLVDREEAEVRIAAAVALGDRGVARTEVMPRDDVLALRRVQVLEIRLGDRASALAIDDRVDDRDRRLGQDADGRQHDLELAVADLLEREQRL